MKLKRWKEDGAAGRGVSTRMEQFDGIANFSRANAAESAGDAVDSGQ